MLFLVELIGNLISYPILAFCLRAERFRICGDGNELQLVTHYQFYLPSHRPQGKGKKRVTKSLLFLLASIRFLISVFGRKIGEPGEASTAIRQQIASIQPVSSASGHHANHASIHPRPGNERIQ